MQPTSPGFPTTPSRHTMVSCRPPGLDLLGFVWSGPALACPSSCRGSAHIIVCTCICCCQANHRDPAYFISLLRSPPWTLANPELRLTPPIYRPLRRSRRRHRRNQADAELHPYTHSTYVVSLCHGVASPSLGSISRTLA